MTLRWFTIESKTGRVVKKKKLPATPVLKRKAPVLPPTPIIKKVPPELKLLRPNDKKMLFLAAEMGLYWAIVQNAYIDRVIFTPRVVTVGYSSALKVATKYDTIYKYSTGEGWIKYENPKGS